MTAFPFFVLFLFVRQTQAAAPQGCNQTFEHVHCPQNWIKNGEDMKCFCKENCREVRVTCNNDGSLRTTRNERRCQYIYYAEEHTINTGEKVLLRFRDNKLTLRCFDLLTIEAGNFSCDATGISVINYPVCLRGPPIPVEPGGCKAFEFRCNNGQCLDLYLRCDGDKDCTDGSDEDLCGTKQLRALQGRFRCRDIARSISLPYRCDNENDCGDNSDEVGCVPGVCVVDQYRCANGECIPGDYVCDGGNDCVDGSDEIYCSRFAARGSCSAWRILSDKKQCALVYFGCNAGKYINSTRPQTCKLRGKCQYNEDQCQNSKCLLIDHFCDGHDFCGDNSDESNCNISQTACPRNEFSCDNGMCVPLSAKCDGKNQCGDGSDEWDCPKPSGGCKPCEFSCVRSGQCVPWNARCDGLFHCTDGSDEWADACSADVPAGCPG